MIDAALIHKCADPGLKPAIVERFIAAAGSSDALAVTVRSGERVILVPPAKTPDEAMALVRQYVGKAAVRSTRRSSGSGGLTAVLEICFP